MNKKSDNRRTTQHRSATAPSWMPAVTRGAWHSATTTGIAKYPPGRGRGHQQSQLSFIQRGFRETDTSLRDQTRNAAAQFHSAAPVAIAAAPWGPAVSSRCGTASLPTLDMSPIHFKIHNIF